jgi:NAD(P)-dependent dehydrogenase (short-subunit alcohol dehydrogenase family)
MEKKVILITGATGGLGKEMTRHFEKLNYNLALHTYQQTPFSISCEHAWFSADLRDENQVQLLIDEVLKRFGRVDILINNAGISRNGVSWKLSVEDFNEVLKVNLTAPFLLIKGFLPKMREAKYGRIINISSVVAQTGVPGTAAYAASKAAVLGMTKTVAKEVASYGITCNALALGYFNAGMIDEVPIEVQQEIIRTIPKGKLGEVSVILKTLEWLLQDEVDYVTGQTISLNGGLFNS